MTTPIKTTDVIERLRNAAQEAYEKLVTVEDGFGKAEVDADDLETICGICEMLTSEQERLLAALDEANAVIARALHPEVQP